MQCLNDKHIDAYATYPKSQVIFYLLFMQPMQFANTPSPKYTSVLVPFLITLQPTFWALYINPRMLTLIIWWKHFLIQNVIFWLSMFLYNVHFLASFLLTTLSIC